MYTICIEILENMESVIVIVLLSIIFLKHILTIPNKKRENYV